MVLHDYLDLFLQNRDLLNFVDRDICKQSHEYASEYVSEFVSTILDAPGAPKPSEQPCQKKLGGCVPAGCTNLNLHSLHCALFFYLICSTGEIHRSLQVHAVFLMMI